MMRSLRHGRLTHARRAVVGLLAATACQLPTPQPQTCPQDTPAEHRERMAMHLALRSSGPDGSRGKHRPEWASGQRSVGSDGRHRSDGRNWRYRIERSLGRTGATGATGVTGASGAAGASGLAASERQARRARREHGLHRSHRHNGRQHWNRRSIGSHRSYRAHRSNGLHRDRRSGFDRRDGRERGSDSCVPDGTVPRHDRHRLGLRDHSFVHADGGAIVCVRQRLSMERHRVDL